MTACTKVVPLSGCLAIPMVVFEDERYQLLRRSEKLLLLELYVQFFDTMLFTAEFPDSVRSVQLARLKRLTEIGFLVVDHEIKARRGYGRRVFRFAYAAETD
jgi:hypothetical protein